MGRSGIPSWKDYRQQFIFAASEVKKSEDYVAACLAYAEPLVRRKLPVIFDEQHLADLVGYQLEYVTAAAYGGGGFYRAFHVPKVSGGFRTISEPLPSLKEIQRWILDNLLARIPVSKFAKAFVPGSSIKSNARFHRRQPFVLSIDLKDFFPSVSGRRTFALFRRQGYSQAVANLLARLCTLDDSLPQGAPSSPAIANLVCTRLDRRLAGYAKKNYLRYTRYADDITLSGSFHPGVVIRFVSRVVSEEGFAIHPEKIRVMEPHQRQLVTGVVVNDHMQAPRPTRRALRQATHFIGVYGLNGHLERLSEVRRHYLSR